MKFLLDENLSPAHAAMLRTMGHDAVAVIEAGLAGSSDAEVAAFAVQQGRILITLDGDFANITRFHQRKQRVSSGCVCTHQPKRLSDGG